MNHGTLSVSCALLVLGSACSGNEPTFATHTTSPISSPSIDPAWSLHPGVGQMHWQGTIQWRPDCSGTLVTPRMVLTAGHCFNYDRFPMDDGSEGPPEAALTFAVYDQNGGVLREVPVIRVRLFSKSNGRDDLALLLLAEPILAVPSIPISPDPLPSGESVLALGFGCNADVSEATGTKRGKEHTWSPTIDPDSGAIIDDGFRPCRLDSGAPVLANWQGTSGSTRVVGIVSRALWTDDWPGITSAALADTTARCSAINAVATAWQLSPRPCPSAAVDLCQGATVPLSPVGIAVAGADGVGAKLSRCVQLPVGWLFNIDKVDNTASDLFSAGEPQLELTRSSFSHAALYDWVSEFHFSRALLKLHENIAAGRTEPVPDGEKPIVRVYLGNAFAIVPFTFARLTADLQAAVPDPHAWNVKVAVAKSNSLFSGWNHSKLTIRDRVEVIATSYETDEHELAVHLAGPAAEHAQIWFDVVWIQSHTTCMGSPQSLCGQISHAPPVNAHAPYAARPINVFALERGELDTGFDDQADNALLAGMNGAKQSIFFLNPGLVGFAPGYTTTFSPILVRKIAERLIAGVDVKFVWGNQDGHPLTPENWQNIENTLDQRFGELGLTATEKNVAHCMFHLAPYTDNSPTRSEAPGTSHAKFYMLDKSFYIGSQNLYPTGFKGEATPPELKEFGFLIDTKDGVNDALAGEVVSRIVDPIWTRSKAAAMPSNHASCGALRHPAILVGTADTSSGSFTCSNGFDLILDFASVERDQTAKVNGVTTCTAAGRTVVVEVHGVILAGGIFDGTIAGYLPGFGGDATALQGRLIHGALNLSFSGLEPIQSVPYRGTVSTRVDSCGSVPLDACVGDCAWYWCAAQGAGACFPRGTPNETACPPSAPVTCAAIDEPDACAGGCAWYWCAAQGAGACFPRGTPNEEACPTGG